MRFLAILIATLASISAVAAETVPERIVALFREICIAPETPEAMMAAGERYAATGGWRLKYSGRGPIPAMHNENGPPDSIVSAWEFDLPLVSKVRIAISIVGPEMPDLRYDSRMIQIPSAEFDEGLNTEVDRQFGSSVLRRAKRYVTNVHSEWFYARDGERIEDCRRSMLLSRESVPGGMFTTLSYLDLAKLVGGKWQGVPTMPECQK